jgi:hypothetical protein
VAGRSILRPIVTIPAVAAAVALIGLATATSAQTRQPPPQRVDFELGFQYGNPSFAGFSWPWQSPDLFDVLRQSNIDVDELLERSGRDIDWLLGAIGKDVDWLLEQSGMTADDMLVAADKSTDWLIDFLDKDADWILATSGNSIDWLLDRTGGTSDQLLAWADKDADWLLDLLGKDADWVLSKAGRSKSNIISWANKSNTWVANLIKDVLCSNLRIGKTACKKSVDAVSSSLSKLMGLIDKDADWWLDEVGEDIDWLLLKTGKSADWTLSQAGKSRSWLWTQLGQDADWVLAKTGKTKGWLLTLTGRSADWLLGKAGYTRGWLLARLGGTADWVLMRTGHGADWVLEQVGWRMRDATLIVGALLELQVVTGEGMDLGYPAATQLQYLPGTPATPRYDRRIGAFAGELKVVEGLGSSHASVTVTYTDPTGLTASAGGDAGMFNQDLAIIVEDERRVFWPTRHADGWLVTMCIPIKEIIAALLAEVPPAAAAVLVLLPDIMMQVNGDVGYTLENEQLSPAVGQIVQFNLPQPQRYYEFVMQYTAQIKSDARMTGGSWGFAWGLMCGPGFGISLGYNIPGGETLREAGPIGIGDQELIRFALAPPSDMPIQQPPPREPRPGQPLPRPGQPLPRPGQPGTVTPEATPAPAPETAPSQQPREMPGKIEPPERS